MSQLYWWGWINNSRLQLCNTANGWSVTGVSGYSFNGPTLQTNYIDVHATGNYSISAIARLETPSSGSTLQFVATMDDIAHSGYRAYGVTNKAIDVTSILHDFKDDTGDVSVTVPTLFSYTYTSAASYYVLGANGGNGRGGYIYAILS